MTLVKAYAAQAADKPLAPYTFDRSKLGRCDGSIICF